MGEMSIEDDLTSTTALQEVNSNDSRHDSLDIAKDAADEHEEQAELPFVDGKPVSSSAQSATINNDNLALASRILAIISRYKLSASSSTTEISNGKFLVQIYSYILRSQPIRMCLPAFPFKSPNTSSKVLGCLPDKAEEFALAHLDGLCASIAQIYKPGARLMIISDGLVYNDLLGVSDRQVFVYGEALRTLAVELNLKHIEFSRLKDLARLKVADDLDEIKYVSNATNFRHALLSQYGDQNFDASKAIHENEDTCFTYRGYLKFIGLDLQDVYPVGPNRSKSQYKKGIEHIAKQMLFRGDAFARAVRTTFSDFIRLSIHDSKNMEDKISISLLPTDTSFTTPWHCCIAFLLDGTTTTGHHSQFDADPRYELVYKNGRPSFYREKTDLLSWGDDGGDVFCEPLYPAGLLIRPTKALSIENIPGEKVRKLAQINSPVILRGFANTRDRDLFTAKAHDLGTPTGWKFGLILEVKDQGTNGRGLNNVLSAEWMPFHYDGLFKTERRVRDNGTEEVVSTPPGFQFFTSVTTSPPNTGFTLFANSTTILRYLPPSLPLQKLRTLTWNVQTAAFDSTVLRGLPLVIDHPATGQPCIRYHERWGPERTKFDPTCVNIEGVDDGEEICQMLEDLLHDRRVCYWHSWEKGDLLVSDNVLAHHTRSDFQGGSNRELWRINFD